jgi:nitroreductase
MDLFEAMRTQRALRRLRPDPVPDELIWKVLEAATGAPSGGNLQPWNFIVIRDAASKRRLHELYLDGMQHVTRPSGAALAKSSDARMGRSARYLAEHLAEAPVLILATVRLADVASTTPPGACIYPAVQNLMLAARALGLGTTLTTLHRHREKDVVELLGIPPGIETMALIPLGWPLDRHGPTRRKPAGEIAFWERWGETHSNSSRTPG